MTSANGIQVDDKQARILLAGMAAAGEDLSRPMAVISHKLANSVRQNFRVGGRYSSEGSILGGSTKWKKVQNPPTYKKGGERGSVLLRSTRLMSSIIPESTSHEALATTNVEYAAIHNFGGKTKAHPITARNGKALRFAGSGGIVMRRSVQHPGSKTPARPFAVIQEQDIQDAETVMVAHVLRRSSTT